MSTQFTVYENRKGRIELDERSGKFDLDVELERSDENMFSTLATLDESQVIDMAVNLLGPLHYYNPGPEIMDAVIAKLKERGYT